MARARAAIQAAARNGMAARRQQVAALLHAGFAQRAIAEQLGVSEATVSRDCAVLLAQWRRRRITQRWRRRGRWGAV